MFVSEAEKLEIENLKLSEERNEYAMLYQEKIKECQKLAREISWKKNEGGHGYDAEEGEEENKITYIMRHNSHRHD